MMKYFEQDSSLVLSLVIPGEPEMKIQSIYFVPNPRKYWALYLFGGTLTNNLKDTL